MAPVRTLKVVRVVGVTLVSCALAAIFCAFTYCRRPPARDNSFLRGKDVLALKGLEEASVDFASVHGTNRYRLTFFCALARIWTETAY